MKHLIVSLSILLAAVSPAAEFRHIGDYALKSYFKLTGAELTDIPMKPVVFKVYTDGITVRIQLNEDENDTHSSYEIYRSDGISRQHPGAGAIEVVPGIQAYTNTGGTLRHLRLTQEFFTITTFPGVSDQTVVSHAVAVSPKDTEPIKKP